MIHLIGFADRPLPPAQRDALECGIQQPEHGDSRLRPSQVHRAAGEPDQHDPPGGGHAGLPRHYLQDVDGSAGARLHAEQLASVPEDDERYAQTQASDLHTHPPEGERDQGSLRTRTGQLAAGPQATPVAGDPGAQLHEAARPPLSAISNPGIVRSGRVGRRAVRETK